MPTVTNWQRELVGLINALRSEHGLSPLTIDASLHDAAGWRAHDMLSRNYFAYDTPPIGPREPARPEGPPSAVIQRFGYTPEQDGWTSAENIVLGERNGNGTVSAKDVLATWSASPAHLQNMISEYFQAIGVGGPAGDGEEQPMAGVCVVEFGSEVVAPVCEPAQPKFLLPREAPPVSPPQAPLDEADRIAVAGAVGRNIGSPSLLPLPTGTKDGLTGVAYAPAEADAAGQIMTPAPWGRFNTDWSQINRWNDILTVASNEFGVPFPRLKAHVVIESQGIPTAVQKNNNNGWSYGLMQVVPFGVGWEGWHADVLRLASHNGNPADMLINDPGLNVRVGAYILSVQKANFGAGFSDWDGWDRASSAFFLGNPNWSGGDTGGSGATGKKYKKALHGLMEEMGATTGTGTFSGTSTGTTAAGTDTGAALAAEALRHVGQQYVWATAGPNTFDCSGLVYYCYEKVTGQDLPENYRDSHQQYLWGDRVDPTQARPGDLVFYDTADGGEWRLGNNASHVGIYGGGNDLINALNEHQGVLVSDLSGPYWSTRWIGTRRVLPTG